MEKTAFAKLFQERAFPVPQLKRPDISPDIVSQYDRPDFKGIVCDLTKEDDVIAGLEETVRTFGGLDMLILNAGIHGLAYLESIRDGFKR